MNTWSGGITRHILSAAGGGAVAFGMIDEGALMEVMGAVATLISFYFSIREKRNRA